jgi:hypothetical protein
VLGGIFFYHAGGSDTFLRNVGFHKSHTALHLRRPRFSWKYAKSRVSILQIP